MSDETGRVTIGPDGVVTVTHRDGHVVWTNVPPLSGFLFSRIAEDEANVAAAPYGADARANDSYFGARPGDDARAAYEDRFDPERLVAESAAKRRIVEIHMIDQHPDWQDGICLGCANAHPCPTLLALAQPYADHPDFREEWMLS